MELILLGILNCVYLLFGQILLIPLVLLLN
jgi:hypothetical protein